MQKYLKGSLILLYFTVTSIAAYVCYSSLQTWFFSVPIALDRNVLLVFLITFATALISLVTGLFFLIFKNIFIVNLGTMLLMFTSTLWLFSTINYTNLVMAGLAFLISSILLFFITVEKNRQYKEGLSL